MRNESNLWVRTNLILCVILIAGFVVVTIVNYSSNFGLLRRNVEHVSELTSESIYYQLSSYLIQPVSVSLTMANDTLLKHLLAEEGERMEDDSYVAQLQKYLDAYKEKYGFHSVFLVSTQTNRYYRYSGLDRVLTPDNPENQWYYDFLANEGEYTLDVDQDESQSANRAVTTFVNCKIYGDDGDVMGVVGVGLHVGNLEELLQNYKGKYGMRAVLIDDVGAAVISSEHDFDDPAGGMFHNFMYVNESNLGSVIAKTETDQRRFWVEGRQGDCFVASQYVSSIQWHLVVEGDFSAIEGQFKKQLSLGVAVTAFIMLSVLVIVNRVLSHNGRLLRLVASQELEYHDLVKKATEEMYEDVYEFDVTHDCAVGEETRKYFQELGLGPDAGFTQAITAIAQQQVKGEFHEGFLAIAMRKDILRAFEGGTREFTYDVMIKRFNDTYGHTAGDLCLKEVARVLRETVPNEVGFVARYGGEEFVIILPSCNEQGARIIAHRLLQNIRERTIPHEKNGDGHCVTFSIGGVTADAEQAYDLEDYLRRADKALYASKSKGRNCYTDFS